MLNRELKQYVVSRLLPRVQTPAQYLGGELNAVVKGHRHLRGRLCLAFPDAYTIGMSCYGLQVLYAAMNDQEDWACERVFTPLPDMEQLLRAEGVPLYSLETFTPLGEFDVVGFTLQYDLCASNILTMLDLAGIPLEAACRGPEHPLVIAGGPGTANPEPLARFIDVFVVGDGELSLPEVCRVWLELKAIGIPRAEALACLAARLPYVYVPRWYEPIFDGGRQVGVRAQRPELPPQIRPAVVPDLEALPLPTAPVVPYVECVQDRLTLEIMRGCPGRCRFCQSTTLKRPLRYRAVETILRAAKEGYARTGYNEISLLSLSTSDYPQFDELLRRLQEEFRPLGVSISVPSLRINEQLRTISDVLNTDRRSGLTLAPEVARDEMRRQVAKPIRNQDLYEGCRRAFAEGFHRVKLYFMCGLPGEGRADLEGIVEMAETIARLGREVRGRPVTVVANVANFVPKPQTPYQWNAMQRREYFQEAHRYLRRRKRLRSVELKCHDIEASLLEGVLCRGDRRLGQAIELAWRRGARLDAWSEHFQPGLWWQALAESGIDVDALLHLPCPAGAPLAWDHIAIRQGREYLAREHARALEQLAAMSSADGPAADMRQE